jgi:hypothetical protein
MMSRTRADLRLVDDRSRDHRAGRARVRERERAPGHVVGREALRPGARGEFGDLIGECDETLAVGGAELNAEDLLTRTRARNNS